MGVVTRQLQKKLATIAKQPSKIADKAPQDLYFDQTGRELEILRHALSPDGAAEFAFQYRTGFGGGIRDDLDQSRLMATVSDSNKERLAAQQAEGNAYRKDRDYELYMDLRNEMGADAFDKAFKGKGLTRAQVYGDTGEFADYPVFGYRVEEIGTRTPKSAPIKGVPSSVGPAEAGTHVGDVLTTRAMYDQRLSPRDYYEMDKLAAESSDPQKAAQARHSMRQYESQLEEAKESVRTLIGQSLPGATLKDVKAIEKGINDFSQEWAKTGGDFMPKTWWNSPEASKKLKELLAEGLNMEEEDARLLMREVSRYFRLANKTSAEKRVFSMAGFKKPLLIHDLNHNTAEAIGRFVAEMPQFADDAEELRNIGREVLKRGEDVDHNTRQALKSDRLFEILSRQGYDVIAYVNQGEGASWGRSISWIVPRDPKGRMPNVADKAPNTAKKRNLLAVSATLAPLWAALGIKAEKAEAAAPTQQEDDGKYFEENGVIYEKLPNGSFRKVGVN